MRVSDVFSGIRALGTISVRRFEGEWRIVPHSQGEPQAYYTDDNEDALCTAVRMHRSLVA